MTRREDIAWAAGLFEGEGCFALTNSYNPECLLTMTDKDCIERLRDIMGFGTISYVKPQREGWKPAWKWRAGGFEQFQSAVVMYWEWLGIRRKDRAVEVLLKHRAHAALDLLGLRPCPNGCGLVTRPGPMVRHVRKCSKNLQLSLTA